MGKKNKNKPGDSAQTQEGGQQPQGQQPQQAGPSRQQPQQQQQQQKGGKKKGGQDQGGPGGDAPMQKEQGKDKQKQKATGGPGGDTAGQAQQQGRGEPRQQQKPQASGPGQPQPQQGAWGKQQSPPGFDSGDQRQQQGGRGQQQRPAGSGPGQQQQPQGAWGQQQRPAGSGQGQPQQPQGAWGQQQRPAGSGQGQPQQPQGAWGQQQRQQQGDRDQRQRPPGFDRGDQRQQQGGRGQQQRPPGFDSGDQRQQQGGRGRGDRGDQRQQQQRPERFGQDERSGQQEQRSEDRSKQDEAYIKKMAELALRPYSPPTGIPLNKGTRGQRVKIEANYLEINIDKMIDKAYHYDISFDPPRPKKYLRPAFNNFRDKYFPKILMAFDGQANVYSPVKINDQELVTQDVIVLEPDGRQKIFKVTLKETLAPIIDLASLKTYNKTRIFDKPMRALQCLDVALNSPIVNSNIAVKAGRVYYVKPPRPADLESGHELWLGLFQAAVLGDRPFLNIDVGHKAFPKDMSLLDTIKGMGRYGVDIRNPLDYRTLNDIYDHLKSLEIIYIPPKNFNAAERRYKFLEVKGPSNKETFKDENGAVLTVDQYFTSKGYKLQYPHLPCIHVGPRIRNIYLPVELCYIPGGQATNKKANEIIVRNIIKYAATSTDVRKQKIMDLFNKFNYRDDLIMKEFKVSIKNEFLVLDARIIPPPRIEYAESKCITPSRGEWDTRNEKYIAPAKKIEWAILNTDFGVNDHCCRDFCSMVLRTSRELNMEMSPQYDVIMEKDRRNLDRQFDYLKKKDLVFVVLSNQKDCYANIKKTAEIKLGVLTQCIKGRTISGGKNVNSVVKNILLKVNAKLNGVNHKINGPCATPIMNNNIMFIGADVTHPAPGESKPSVVGVASSFDSNAFQYCMRWRLQDSKQEIISDMQNIMEEQLNFFKKQNGKLPEKIIYYRDGVSEGQFEDIRKVELASMDKACARVQPNYKPDITCLVVQKRHHTRFFPPDKSNVAREDPKNRNVPPGTIVDSVITHPAESQFFLVSHRSLQGVAKPAKYCILRDNSQFNIDDLQALTFNLCHMFTRCNRSVSYAAPAYYAHLAAYRGRVYIEDVRFFDNLEKTYNQLRIKENILLNRPMFFV